MLGRAFLFRVRRWCYVAAMTPARDKKIPVLGALRKRSEAGYMDEGSLAPSPAKRLRRAPTVIV